MSTVDYRYKGSGYKYICSIWIYSVVSAISACKDGGSSIFGGEMFVRAFL